jgi:hypothetical protein
MDADQLRKSIRSVTEEFQERRDVRNRMTRDGLLSAKENSALDEKDRRDSKGKLGIKDPLGDYLKQSKELDEAYQSGKLEISDDEYNARKKELRQGAIQGIAGESRPSASPIGAMEAGSAAAHSIIAQNMMPDPKVRIAQEINENLKKLVAGQISLAEAQHENNRILKE